MLYAEPMANPLLTNSEMALWCATTEAVIASDPYAQEVREKVSQLIRLKAGHPEWDDASAPVDVRMVAIVVCKRTYLNPDQEVSSNVGPLGSRVLDIAALATELTDAELATITGYDTATEDATGFWTLSLGGVGPLLEPTVYLPDDSGSDWWIPFGDPNDVNSPTAPGNLP